MSPDNSSGVAGQMPASGGLIVAEPPPESPLCDGDHIKNRPIIGSGFDF
jgi:hypothetical protein